MPPEKLFIRQDKTVAIIFWSFDLYFASIAAIRLPPNAFVLALGLLIVDAVIIGGIWLGKRWGFIATLILSLLTVPGEVLSPKFWHFPVGINHLQALGNIFLIGYCVFRLRAEKDIIR